MTCTHLYMAWPCIHCYIIYFALYNVLDILMWIAVWIKLDNDDRRVPSVWCAETAAHYLVNEMIDELIVILTCDNDYTVMTVLTDRHKTHHITSEAWTIRGVQNPNYTLPVWLSVVKIKPLQLKLCGGLYMIMTSIAPVSLNNIQT